MKKAIILALGLTCIAGAGLYPSLGASVFFTPNGGAAIYYHGGIGYAFPEHWDMQLGVGYVSWTHDDQTYSIMPVMGSGTYHVLPRDSWFDLYGGLGLGYAWRHWGDAGDNSSPCGEVFAGTAVDVGGILGLGLSGGYLMDDLGQPDQGGFGLGVNLGIGVPF